MAEGWVIGRWYYFWSTTVRELAVMNLGWLSSTREKDGETWCRFVSNTNIVYEVPEGNIICEKGSGGSTGNA